MANPTMIDRVTVNKEDYDIWVEAYICSFHREHPGLVYPGCSCCSAFGISPKDNARFVSENKQKMYDALDEL